MSANKLALQQALDMISSTNCVGWSDEHDEVTAKALRSALKAVQVEPVPDESVHIKELEAVARRLALDREDALVDAKRYRWLREQFSRPDGLWVARGQWGALTQWNGEKLDASIDAELGKAATC